MNFEGLYREHAEQIYHYIYAKCQDPELAKDIVQTTFLKAVSKIDTFQGQCKLSSWLCQIAKNEYLNHCRKYGRQSSLDAFIEEKGECILSDHKEVIDDIIQKDQAKEAQKAIGMLPEPYKEVLRLRLYGEYSFEEIGDMFGQSDTWARVTFYRAKKKVIQEMERGGNL